MAPKQNFPFFRHSASQTLKMPSAASVVKSTLKSALKNPTVKETVGEHR